MTHKPRGAGKSSFDLVDSSKLFSLLPLKDEVVVLDLGCGSGNYTMAIAPRLGPSGLIYAVDLWADGIEQLEQRARTSGFRHVKALVGDVGEAIPVPDRSVDVCLMATVFHDFVEDGIHDRVLQEIQRVLKPRGVVAIVEFKKLDGPPGPPKHVRLSQEELEAILNPYGFARRQATDLGEHTYLSLFGPGTETE